MTSIEFYFDPACPFCWITSRWLTQVSTQRKIDITWHQFSLAIKNDVLTERPDESKYDKLSRSSHRIHRVIHAAKQHGASVADMYSEFGISHHILEKSFDDELIKEILAKKGLPAELLESADDTSIDKFLQSEIDSAIEAAGPDIGVPVIVLTSKSGKRLGYFGPVLNELPSDIEESLAIWDGLEKLASSEHFYEIKRARPSGDPNVFSAAKC